MVGEQGFSTVYRQQGRPLLEQHWGSCCVTGDAVDQDARAKAALGTADSDPPPEAKHGWALHCTGRGHEVSSYVLKSAHQGKESKCHETLNRVIP